MHETSRHCQVRNQSRHQSFSEEQYQENCTCQHTATATILGLLMQDCRSKQEVDIGRPKALRAPGQEGQQPTKGEVPSIWTTKLQEDRCDGRPRRNLTQRRNAELSKRRAGGDETKNSDTPRDARQWVGSEERGRKPQRETLRLAPSDALGEKAVATLSMRRPRQGRNQNDAKIRILENHW